MEFSDLNTDRQLTPEELAELKRPNRDQLYPPLEDEAEDEERISNLMAIKGGLSEQSQEEDLDTLIEALLRPLLRFLMMDQNLRKFIKE